MGLALLQLIPLSLAAITPTMVILVTALLAQDGHTRRAFSVVIGRFLGLLVFGFVTIFLLHQVPSVSVPNKLDQHELLPAILLISGSVLMLAAAFTVLSGKVPSEQNQHRLEDRMRSLHWPLLFAVCFGSTFVSIRLISLILAGSAIIKAADTDKAGELVLLVVFCLLMIWPMLVPLAIKIAGGKRGDDMLLRLRDWMATHQRAINAIVLAFFGGLLVAKGISALR